MSALPPVCILAGGLGTRLGERTRETPKALLAVAGEPFLWHQLRLLAQHGAGEVVLCVGHLGEQIQASVGSKRFGLRIAYSFDAPGLEGTLGAIRRARGLLGERFLVLYGDTYLRLDYAAAATDWRASGLPAMMTVLRNEGRWETSNASYAAGRVVAYDKRTPHPRMRWIDYGLGGLEQAALDRVPPPTRELSDLLGELASEELLYGYEVTERFFEIGTPGGAGRGRRVPTRQDSGLPRHSEEIRLARPPACPPTCSPAPRGRSPREALPQSARPLAFAADVDYCSVVHDREAVRTPFRADGVRGMARVLLAPDSGLLGEGVRFVLAGSLGLVVYLLVTTLLAAVLGLPFQVALVVGFCAALSVNFVSQRQFVWAKQEYMLPTRRQTRRYLLAASVQYGVTVLGTSLLPSALEVSTEAVYVSIVLLLAFTNFAVLRYGVFHGRSTTPESSAALVVKTA